jgi:hypothetical protein
MSGDPVGQLIEEITALRRSVEHLARTSLDKDEAKTLNELVVEGVDRMTEAAVGARSAVRHDLEADRAQTARLAVQSAAAAAQGAVEGVKTELEAERRSYAEALSDAHRAARRANLRSWPWVGGLLATGALLRVLMVYGTETAKSVLSVKDTIRVACEYSLLVGGQRVTQDSGWTFCAVPIEGPNGERP